MGVESSVPERERMKRLVQAKDRQERELQGIEEQKKALEAEEQKRKKAIEETDAAIEDTEEDLRELEEESDVKGPAKTSEQEIESIDELIEQEVIERRIIEEVKPYGEAIEQIRYGSADIYALTDYAAYGKLTELRDRLAGGETIGLEERSLVNTWQRQIGSMIARSEHIANHDEFGYVKRSNDVLAQISTYLSRPTGDQKLTSVRRGPQGV